LADGDGMANVFGKYLRASSALPESDTTENPLALMKAVALSPGMPNTKGSVGAGIRSGAEDHHLRRSSSQAFRKHVVDVPRSDMDAACEYASIPQCRPGPLGVHRECIEHDGRSGLRQNGAFCGSEQPSASTSEFLMAGSGCCAPGAR
jgi:hypothetical protein